MKKEKNEKINITFEPELSKEEEEKRIKKDNLFIIFTCVSFLIIGLIIGLSVMYLIHPISKGESLDTLGEIESVLDKYWIYEDNYDNLKKQLEDKAYYGMTQFSEDPYTTYMSKSDLDSFTSSINMDYVGIGVQYSLTNDCARIERVFVNSPAQAAGLQPGDIITMVDNDSVKGLTSEEIKNLVLGEEGTIVKVTVLRGSETIPFDIVRGSVDNSIYCYSVEDKYVVMELESFGASTAKECMDYLDAYTDYDKLIIDIRDNSGGYQTSVKELAGLFVGNEKIYLKQKDAQGKETADYTSCIKTYDNFKKIVILINENTASAAEVFAICLKEYLPNQVTLVGTTTFGKGVIQSTHYLLNGGALKFSTYYWYSPSGVSIHLKGVEPDIEVKQEDIFYESYINMDDNESYKYDSVSESVRLSEIALKFLGYNVSRCDGYFDKSFETTLKKYKQDNNLGNNVVLDKTTYESIISDVIYALSLTENDKQMNTAIDIINK